MTINMKKLILAGIIVLIAAFVVTCDEAPIAGEEIVEYTDVVYSPDGSQVTIYLDGVTVPVTKAQRAMTLGLAMMSYDYLEVVFRNAGGFSRTNWELGQPAGISGAGLRGANTINYNGFGTPTGACLFAGKKDGKTLFGVGKMTSITNTAGVTSTYDGTTVTILPILDDTASVTFSLAAIQTGLLIGADDVAGTYATKHIPVDSFTFTGGYARNGHSSYQTLLDKVKYPTYQLPTTTGDTTATYTFKFMTGLASATPSDVTTTGNYLTAILHAVKTDNVKPAVYKRTPRFMDGGRYMQPNGHIDTKTKVALDGVYDAPNTSAPIAGGGPFVNVVPLKFSTIDGNTGIFSFYLEIPVLNLDNRPVTTPTPTPATENLNGGPGPLTWYIRTGLGSDLYSLDDGESSGGCVFMSTGISNSDWLSIDWKWAE